MQSAFVYQSSSGLVSSLTGVLVRQCGGRLPAVAADLKHLQPATHHGWRPILGRVHAGERLSPAVVLKIETFPTRYQYPGTIGIIVGS